MIMKKILFLLAMLPMMCYAQKGFEPSVKVGYEIPIDDNQSFGADFLAGYRLSETFKVGIGIGAYWCEHLYSMGSYDIIDKEYNGEDYNESAMYIPIYANGKINFTKKGISPYFSLDLGYSVFVSFSDYADENKLGLFVRPTFGLDFPLNSGKIFAEVGYKYQKRDWELLENPSYSQITISVGYTF